MNLRTTLNFKYNKHKETHKEICDSKKAERKRQGEHLESKNRKRIWNLEGIPSKIITDFTAEIILFRKQ